MDINDFLKVFDELAYNRNRFKIFHDFVMMMALSFAQSVIFTEAREKDYMEIVRHYSKEEISKFVQLNGIMTLAFEENPKQDFLGMFWMNEGYGDVKKGQYSSPYSIAELTSRLTFLNNAKAEIEEKGWFPICDCACGSGVMLIAGANFLKEQGINYHEHVLFIGQEIDPLIAHMGYIQMALLGLPGYMRIGDTLSKPMTGPVLFPLENDLITPLFLIDPWNTRRKIWKMNHVLGFN